MAIDKQYTVYHLHSDLSNGITNIDSVTKYGEYIEKAKELGMKAMAFSEHGSVFEWWHKKSAIEAAGMKYIHAVEAYIGHSNTRDTEENAKRAVKMIFDNIETVYRDGKNIEARGEMLLASYYAGVAFTRAYVGYVHAIAHNLGGMYGIAHGLANAIILPYVLEYYGESAHKRLAELAEAASITQPGMTDAQKAEAFIAAIRRLNQDMNIPDKIEQIQEKDIPTLVERALKEGNPLYPVPKIMNEADCEMVIRRLMP